MATDNDQTGNGQLQNHSRILCLTGPESTGKSTLAEILAQRLSAPLVPEVARQYLLERPGYSQDDVLEIARQQVVLESEALAGTHGIVVCDTDLTVIRIWWEEKYGPLPEILLKLLAARSDRAYLLAEPDLPWEPDSLRENPGDRDRLFVRYRAILEGDAFPFRKVSGSGDMRTQSALSAVRELFPELPLMSGCQNP